MNPKNQFPILKEITFLDSASGHLKPSFVINAIKNFYLKMAVSPHCFDSPLGHKINLQIANVKAQVANLVGVTKEEVIFTSGTTESLNMIAQMLKGKLKKNDEIVISCYNHNANILPWLKLEQEIQVKVVITSNIIKAISKRTKIIALSQKNNSIYEAYDLDEIHQITSSKNIILVNDAAQAIAWEPVSLQNCDVIVFSGNKIYGPTGIGTLIINKKLLTTLKPQKLGGQIITSISDNHKYVFKKGSGIFEAGTPNTAGIIGLGAALTFFNKTKNYQTQIFKLARYAYQKLALIPGVKLHTKAGEIIIIFDFWNYPAQDVVTILAYKHSLYLQGGSFCAHLCRKNETGSIRLSLALYNTKTDIDKLVKVLSDKNFTII